MRMVLVAFFLLGLVGCSTHARTGDEWRMENKKPSAEELRLKGLNTF